MAMDATGAGKANFGLKSIVFGCFWTTLNTVLAGAPGFEPGMPVPKTGALPLGDAPTRQREGLDSKAGWLGQSPSNGLFHHWVAASTQAAKAGLLAAVILRIEGQV